MAISLKQALRISTSQAIAFIGSGGKTTAMFQLARELAPHSPVIITASAHLGAWQTSMADRHIIVESPTSLEMLNEERSGITLVTGPLDGDRTQPLNDFTLDELQRLCIQRAWPLLIEADGSRQKPLKAWADHEPPIPAFADLIVEVVGLSGLGGPLDEDHVHRTLLFSDRTGLKLGELITPNAITRALTNLSGGLRNVRPNIRKVLILNQADTPELQAAAHGMSHSLLAHFNAVIVSSLARGQIFAVHELVAGIILAAGGSKRLGRPKQLLDWKGQPFVRVVAQTALQAGLWPVIVVTGADHEQVESAVHDLNVTIIRNTHWEDGQASSIREGVRTITSQNNSGAGIFLLVDQPQVTASVLRALVEKHAAGLYPVVAPLVIDRRANPVLFDQVTFSDLMQLEGDVGGRAILHKYQTEYLPWHDDRLLLDVDTDEQYQRLIMDDTL